MANTPNQPPIDAEAQAGNNLPDPVLAPRALAELRAAFGPSLEVGPEADLRVLSSLQTHRRRTEHRAGFWRGFQIAAVLGIVASVALFMQARRESFAEKGAFASVKQERDRRAAESTQPAPSPAASPAPTTIARTDANANADITAAPTTQAMLASDGHVTILDVLNLARKAEKAPPPPAKKSAGFKPSGSVVSPFDEVKQLAGKVVGCEPSQIPALSDHAATPKDPILGAEAMRAPAPAGETRILTYDIMLDVGSRDLAAFQIEISMSSPDTARVTGKLIRGGDHPALQRQPLFDSSRVTNPGASTTFTIANFDTGKDLPRGDVRVARIVLIVVGPGHPGVTARLVIAAGAEGVPIPAGLRVVERAPIAGADLKQKQLEKAVEEAEALPPAK